MTTVAIAEVYITFKNVPVEVHAFTISKAKLYDLESAYARLKAIKKAQKRAGNDMTSLPPTRHGFKAPNTHYVVAIIVDAGEAENHLTDTDWILCAQTQNNNNKTVFRRNWNVILVNNSSHDLTITVKANVTTTTEMSQNTGGGFIARNLTLSE